MTGTPLLNDAHRRMLMEESALSGSVIDARGYFTETTKSGVSRLGFSDRQCNVPGLVIPIHNVLGECINYQLRPDRPRIVGGKPVKYETPRGTTMVLDVHPHVRHLLSDPAMPLFITEGIKKGDALVSAGVCAIALLGVWNWRGTNDHGGKTALADWEHVALNGRRVYIVFDSDVMTNQAVYGALVRLSEFLKQRGAN